MTKWTVYSKNGEARCECVVDYTPDKNRPVRQDTLEYSGKWMGECFLTVSIKSPYPIDFQIGDYIIYRGEKFTINYDPTAIKKARRGTYGEGFTYDSIKFNSYSNELTEIMFHDWVLSDNKYHYTSLPNFSFYCKDVDDLVDRLQANTNRWCKANGFKKEDYWMFYTLRNNTTTGTQDKGQSQTTYERTIQRAQDISTDTAFVANVKAQWEKIYGTGTSYKDSRDDERYDRTITASTQTVWDMMTAIKQQFGLNFIIRGRNVYIGTAGIPTSHIFKYGKNNGLYEVDKTADQDQKVVTKLHAYGSDENLPTRYYADMGKQVGCIVNKVIENTQDGDDPKLVFNTNLPFSSRYFYDVLESSVNADKQLYKVAVKISSTSVNGYVYADVDGNTEFLANKETEPNEANLKALMQEIAPKAIIYFMNGMRANTFPTSFNYYIPTNLPDNMAVNFLMLPGFPKNSLSDLCKAEYDESTDTTTYSIRKDKDSEYIAFHTEEGKHIITFSDNKYDPYILSPNATELGIKEGDIFCNEENDDNGLKKVYPSIEEVTNAEVGITTGNPTDRIDEVVKADVIEDNGVYPNDKTDNVPGFNIYIPNVGFDLKQAAEDAGGSDMKISMKNGFCGGRTFDVANVSQQEDGTWKLNCKRTPDNDLDLYFPYSYAASVKDVSSDMTNAYQVVKGDNFVLTGIAVSDVNYVWAASVKLLSKAIHWLCKNDYTRYVYNPKIDEIYMARQDALAKADKTGATVSLHDTLKEGDMLMFEDEDLQLSLGAVYIDQLNIKENGNNGIPTYEVTLRNEIQVGTIQRIQNQVDSIKTDISTGNIGGGYGGMTPAQVDPLVHNYGLKYFLSKLSEDTAQKLITFLEGIRIASKYGFDKDGNITSHDIKSDSNADIAGNVHSHGIGNEGDIVNKGDLSNDGLAQIRELRSIAYTDDDILSGKGLRFYDENGRTHLLTDFLTVRQKAYFSELDIRKISFIGGDNIMSAAGNTIVKVEKVTDTNGNGYKCYFMADDGTDAVENMWKVGDQAKCQTFNNAKAGTNTDASNRQYWRLVTSVGTEEVNIGTDDNHNDITRTMGYVVLSDNDNNPTTLTDTDGTIYEPWDAKVNRAAQFYCKDTSVEQSVPQAGDTIVQLGSQTDTGRMKAIRLRVTKEPGSNVAAPAIVFYSGIDSYDLTETFTISPDGVTGELRLTNITIKNDAGQPVSISNWRGIYKKGTTYYKNDTTSYGGQMWTWGNAESTTTEPSAENGWTLVVAKGSNGSADVYSISPDVGAIRLDTDGRFGVEDIIFTLQANGYNITAQGLTEKGQAPDEVVDSVLTVYLDNRKFDATPQDAQNVGEFALSLQALDSEELLTDFGSINVKWTAKDGTLLAQCSIPIVQDGDKGDAAVTYDVQASRQSAVVTPPQYDTKTGEEIDANSYINIDCSYTVDKIVGTVRTDCTSEAKLRWRYDNTDKWSDFETASNGELTIFVKNGKYAKLPSEVYVEVYVGGICIKSFVVSIVLEAQTYIKDIPGLFQRTVANAESYSEVKASTKEISTKVSNLSTRYRNELAGSDLADVSKLGGHLYTNNTDAIINTAEVSKAVKHDGLNSVHVKTVAADYYVGVYFMPIAIAHKTKYHVAFWAKGKGTVTTEYKYKSEATTDTSMRDGDVKDSRTFVLTDDWQLFEDDFTTDGTHDYMECNFWCNDADTECWLSGFMLETGEVYTGWTPNVNDQTAEERMSAEINVKADEVSASVTKDIEGKLSKTGIDIESGKIDINTQVLNINGNDGNKYIYINVDSNGFPHLVFINPQTGKPAYDLGYNGLSQLIEYAQKAGFDTIDIFSRVFNVGDTITGEYLWNVGQTTSDGQIVMTGSLYLFHAATTNGSNGKTIYTTPRGAELDGHVYQTNGLNIDYEPSGLEAEDGIYIKSEFTTNSAKNERTFLVYVVKDGKTSIIPDPSYDYIQITVEKDSSEGSSLKGVTTYNVWYEGHESDKGTSLTIKEPVEK